MSIGVVAAPLAAGRRYRIVLVMVAQPGAFAAVAVLLAGMLLQRDRAGRRGSLAG